MNVSPSRGWLVGLLTVAAIALSACGGGDTASAGDVDPAADTTADTTADATADTSAPEPGLSLVVRGPDGVTPDSYELIVTNDGLVLHASCGGPAPVSDGELSCADLGAHLAATPSSVTITVKARGFRFLPSVAAAPAYAPVEPSGSSHGERATVELTLQPLAAAEVTADYRTGFSAEEGAADFESLAYSVDTELGPTKLVKFYISGLAGEPTVYFQNTKTHPIHYDFVHTVLGRAISLADFEAQTYSGADRVAMAGTVVAYPSVSAQSAALGTIEAPYAVTFFPSDDLTPAQARLAQRLIEERLGFAPLSGGKGRVVYLPAGSQQSAALAGAAGDFAAEDALWVTREELYGSLTLQLLNPGLAYGTLRLLTPEELESTVVSFSDILVLTRLPNSLPIVGGTITEELQTPLAHVNVAARARGTPNIALLGASGDDRVAPLLGKLARFEVTASGFTLLETTLAEAQAFWKEKKDKPPFVPTADVERDGLLGFADIGFADAVAVGAKAANVAELSHILGAKAPHGFAVPFHYFDGFMATATATAKLCDEARVDCVSEGRDEALCDGARSICVTSASEGEPLFAYLSRLLADAGFQSDTPLREACLDGLRYLIRHTDIDPALAADLDARVAAEHGAAKVRLRSSTNVEDLPDFSGAGLYQSVSAYATGKDAASKEIRKVWASAYSFEAFEERAFWNVDQEGVRMGVLVHQAFPDEAANGVLITQNIADPSVAGMYVNVQAGELSVTNPEGGALPEIFSIVPAPSGLQVARQRFSSLSPDTPIMTDAEVAVLYSAAAKVQGHFAPLYGVSPFVLKLDIEFKLHGPERALILKQVRPYFESAGH